MKRYSILLFTMLLLASSLMARPALQGTRRVQQPDGSFVTVRLVGDEYLHYHTTADGFTLVLNNEGYYVYAQKDASGLLAPTDLVAHDAEARTAAETNYLKSAGRVVPTLSGPMKELSQKNHAARVSALEDRQTTRYDYNKFRGLVILVEYNDCPFRYEDYNDIMNHMINDDNYVGDQRTNISSMVKCTGSMRDYYRDNSNGIFVPTFDVVGPVKVDRSQYYPDVDKNEHDNTKAINSARLMMDACTAADDQVNFADYDVDGNGTVDMIYFIFSGLPSYIDGNDPRLLWPHQSDLRYYGNVKKDGVYIGRFACSTELFGTSDWQTLEGIGTMCHEFSHVLGLPDFYDSGNMYPEECESPMNWSVMAAGSDYNYGRTPCGFSLFERYALGFATPEVITEVGNFSLEALNTSNSGYRINTPVKREYFILENRQKKKWDAQLPGHGMLIFRVDSTNATMWNNNCVNDNPKHPYYQLIRAGGMKTNTYNGQSYNIDATSDPFPGTDNVRVIDNETSPANLKTWSGRNTQFGLRNITERNGVISFDVFDVAVLTDISLPQSVTIGIGSSLQLTPTLVPDYAPATLVWTSSDNAVATVGSDGTVTGVAEGTATITVTANGTLSATCMVTVKGMTNVDNIAAFRALEEGSEALLTLDNAQVLYVNKNDIYLRDASGSIVLSNTGLKVKAGNILNGILYGQLTMVNRMAQLQPVSGVTQLEGVVVSEGSEVEPKAVHLSQLDSDLYADMVTVEKTEIGLDGALYAIFGSKKVRLYNLFQIKGIKVPTDYSKRYNITAIFGTNTLNGEVIDELYLLSQPVQASYTAPASVSLPQTIRLTAGLALQLKPALEPESADVWLRWSSDNDAVATVNDNGVLTAIAEGTATITATDRETGLQAQTVVTVGERQKVADIAAFKALPEGSDAAIDLDAAQVLYVYNQDVYLRDASGAIVLRGFNVPLTARMNVSGSLQGVLAQDNGLPVMLPVSDGEPALTTAAGEDPQPRAVTVNGVDDSLLADLIVLKAAPLQQTTDGMFAYGDEQSVRLYNQFGIKGVTVPKTIVNKYFDITGILTTVELNGGKAYQLALFKSPVEVDAPDGIAMLKADGVKVSIEGDMLLVSDLTKGTPVVLTGIDGRVVAADKADGRGRVTLPMTAKRPALYILRIGQTAFKLRL